MPSATRRTFSDRHTNVAAKQVADVYARALGQAVSAAGKTDATLAEFDSFIADVLDRVPKLEAVFSSALVSAEEKVALLDKALSKQASPLFLSFLRVVARHGRLDIIRPIHLAAHDLFDKMRHIVRVQVASVAELSDAVKSQITETVKKMLGGNPVLETELWPELVGGMMMRVGDTVYDGSISTRLETIRQKMIDRSVYEIQSRRDRFSSPEGN